MKPTILYVTTNPIMQNTSANIRNRNLIDGLINNGNKVYVLCPYSEDVLWNNKVTEIVLGKKIERISASGSNIEKKSSMLWSIKKIISSFMLYDGTRRLIKFYKTVDVPNIEFDYVISSSDPKTAHVIVEKLLKAKRLKAKKWIQYWGDPFYSDINKLTRLPDCIVKGVEKRLISKANMVMYTAPMTLQRQQNIFPRYAEKMIFVPTGYTKQIITGNLDKADDVLTVGYIGTYNKRDRDIEPLYNAIKQSNGYRLVIAGRSDVQLSSTSDIDIYNEIPFLEAVELEAKCDILICIGNRSGSPQIPGKIYHYASTDKIIIYLYDDYDVNCKYLDSLNRFYMVKNDISNIKSVLNQILQGEDLMNKPLASLEISSIAESILREVDEHGDRK